MLIGTFQALAKMPDIHVHIDNEPLNQVTVAKYLGMVIESNLKCDDHINELVPNISAKIGILRNPKGNSAHPYPQTTVYSNRPTTL